MRRPLWLMGLVPSGQVDRRKVRVVVDRAKRRIERKSTNWIYLGNYWMIIRCGRLLCMWGRLVCWRLSWYVPLTLHLEHCKYSWACWFPLAISSVVRLLGTLKPRDRKLTVKYKLQSRQWETTYLAPDMPPAQKKAVLQQWRLSSPMNGGPRFMVIFDVNVKPPEVPWAPLIINFDLPRSVEGYAARAAAGVPPGGRNGQVVWQQQLIPGAVTGSGTQGQGQAQGQAQGQGQGGQGQGQGVFGVIVSFVQAAGGDVEMLRSTECAYRFKVSVYLRIGCGMARRVWSLFLCA